MVHLPSLQIPVTIVRNPKWFPYFENCIGALHGTHVEAKVAPHRRVQFCNKYGYPSQNVLIACKFNSQFCYVFPGSEGSAHDSQVLDRAMAQNFFIPHGKYYLADASYGMKKGILVPYSGVRYHLSEHARADAR